MSEFQNDPRTARAIALHLERFISSTTSYFDRLGLILAGYCRCHGLDQAAQDFSREFVIANQAFSAFSREGMALHSYLMTHAASNGPEIDDFLLLDELPKSLDGDIPVLLTRLLETTSLMEADCILIRRFFADLGEYWIDPSFFRFHQAFNAGTKALARFIERTQSFVLHLDRLSQAKAA
jgi:hypothetical protein